MFLYKLIINLKIKFMTEEQAYQIIDLLTDIKSNTDLNSFLDTISSNTGYIDTNTEHLDSKVRNLDSTMSSVLTELQNVVSELERVNNKLQNVEYLLDRD